MNAAIPETHPPPPGETPREPLVEVRDLAVAFPRDRAEDRAVDGISYAIRPGRTLGVVGESGCGKTVAALALLRLVPAPGRITGGEIVFDGRDLLALSPREMEALRGDRIAMIFQEPMTALNPVLPVGEQIAEVLVAHRDASPREAREAAIALLDAVGIADAPRRADEYPHRLSGGQRQRVMIAMALACGPALLVADEPTTALDVTVQAQIVALLLRLQDETGMAIQFISHNLGVISEIADEVAVMYAGRIVERAPIAELLAAPAHPYTLGLLETVPRLGARRDRGSRRLPAIPGSVPPPGVLIRGCAFRARCARARADCAESAPPLEPLAPGHWVACFAPGGR